MSVVVNQLAREAARVFHRLGLSGLNRYAKGLLRDFTRDRLVINVDGFRLEGSVDNWTLLHQLQARAFEPFERDLFVNSLRRGMSVLDIGANIGYYALLASRAVGTEGRVYAFEPDPRSYRCLVANLAANRAQNVRAFEAAVSESTGRRTLYMKIGRAHV